MSPTYCIHKTLDRANDGLHYCIDCRMKFTIHQWMPDKDSKEAQAPIEGEIPIIKEHGPVAEDKVPKWLIRAYRWLWLVMVLALIGLGAFLACKKIDNSLQTNESVEKVVKKTSAMKESCQVSEETEKLRLDIIKCIKEKQNLGKCEDKPQKIVYVPSPNKCTCTEAIKAACGQAREVVKSLIRKNWRDKAIRDTKRLTLDNDPDFEIYEDEK